MYRSVTIAVLMMVGFVVNSANAGNDILWVHEDIGPGFDQGWIDLLEGAGHTVNKRIFTDLDQAAIDEMNGSSLVIFSRNTNSGNYVDGAEPQQWNGITAPMIIQTAFTPRSSRWLMVDNTAIGIVTANLEAVDPSHPLFDGVALDGSNQVALWDPTAIDEAAKINLLETTDYGNATVIAQEAGTGFPLAAEWNPGDEFYSGSGEIAGGRRLFLAGGSNDDDNSWGGRNYTAAGDQILLNAVNYMAVPEPASMATVIGLLLCLGGAMRRRI